MQSNRRYGDKRENTGRSHPPAGTLATRTRVRIPYGPLVTSSVMGSMVSLLRASSREQGTPPFRSVTSMDEVSTFRGKFVAYKRKNERREPVHDGLYFGYISPEIDRWGVFDLGHELIVVWLPDQEHSRHVLLADKLDGFEVRLATPVEMLAIAKRVRAGQLTIGLRKSEQRRLVEHLERGQDDRLLPLTQRSWRLRVVSNSDGDLGCLPE